MTIENPSIAALRKTVTVPVDPATAFDIFTARMNEWWPLATHSVGEEEAVKVTCGHRVGETIYETLADGSMQTWGKITAWEPPSRVAFTWHPGNPVSQAGLVEVTFTPRSPEVTVVELVHSGWEQRQDGIRARQNYDSGWDRVLAPFTTAVVSARH